MTDFFTVTMYFITSLPVTVRLSPEVELTDKFVLVPTANWVAVPIALELFVVTES